MRLYIRLGRCSRLNLCLGMLLIMMIFVSLSRADAEVYMILTASVYCLFEIIILFVFSLFVMYNGNLVYVNKIHVSIC